MIVNTLQAFHAHDFLFSRLITFAGLIPFIGICLTNRANFTQIK